MNSNNNNNNTRINVANERENENNAMDEEPPGMFMLTPTDLQSLDDPATLQRLPDSVLGKIEEAQDFFRSPHVIDPQRYDTIFITSDIHADLGKFDMLLQQAGIVRVIDRPELAPLSPLVRLISQREWVAERTLLIIVGDIVDGRRNNDYFEVPDPKGNIELLLHAYLYNLRIQADRYASELRFTIGNHDYDSVIQEDSPQSLHFYEMHVHRSAKGFFVNRAGRKACLMPFYNCCPYLMVSVANEIVCVHGGFLGYNGVGIVDNTDITVRAQTEIDTAGGLDGLSAESNIQLATSQVRANLPNGLEYSPLWSRRYAYGTEAEVCEDLGARYALTVVGHCQTGGGCCVNGAHTRAILSRPEYMRHQCHNDGGCVISGCADAQGAPRLTFVDIAMSRAFNPVGNPIDRSELLYLYHDPTLSGPRYYNRIERRNAGGNGTPNEPVWAAPALPPPAAVTGGRRVRRRSKVRRRKTRGGRRRKTKRRA
jgi:hypothetical protein